MKVQEITIEFITQAKVYGSTQKVINVNRNGQPFAQLWTWPNTATETHPWHAKLTATEECVHFYAAAGGLAAAKEWVVTAARAV